jgi:hypothetical protein
LKVTLPYNPTPNSPDLRSTSDPIPIQTAIQFLLFNLTQLLAHLERIGENLTQDLDSL